MNPWDDLVCGYCNHLASKHREHKNGFGEKICDGYEENKYWERCECRRKKEEVVFNYLDKRIDDLTDRIEVIEKARNSEAYKESRGF